MKIVMFSINPLYPGLVTGGASKHLYHIASHMAGKGHQIDIYCAQPKGKPAPFIWKKNVEVFPVLPFNLPFPQPYAISGADLGRIAGQLSLALMQADRFYIHDGEMLLPDIYEHIPTIVSFRDNIYPESVLGSFIHKADEVISVSDYSASVIEYTAGRFFPELNDRIHQVNNGINLNEFSSIDPTKISKELDISLGEERILLHPHRPEPGKGLPETIKVVASLVHEHKVSKLKVIIPEWIDEMVSSQETTFYRGMMKMMKDLKVRENFQFIPWLAMNRMKELYSLGDVTLCLGNIVEAFGNVAYESLACGTPSVVSRVGVHRTLMPEALINKVHYGDIPDAVDRIRSILNGNYPAQEKVQAFIQSDLNFDQQVRSYSDIIENCTKRKHLRFTTEIKTIDTSYMLAPWCYLDGERVYHDFHSVFVHEPQLAGIFHLQDAIKRTDKVCESVTDETWDSWLERTYIVPQIEK